MSETTATYEVVGMACAGCAATVAEETERVPGVISATVDVAGDSMTVTSRGEPDLEAVRAAVEEAGYGLAPRHNCARGSRSCTTR